MSNPVEGQDLLVVMTAKDENGDLVDLVGATVTIEYRNPDGDVTDGLSPTSVNTTTSVITYKMQDSITTRGIWVVGAKVVNASGDILLSNPSVKIKFDRKLEK